MTAAGFENRSIPSHVRQRDLTRPVLIALVLFACAAIAMLLITILWLSFIEGAPGDAELGYTFANYAAIFGDPFTYRVIRNTFAFLAVTLIVSFSLGLPIAWLMERTDFPGKPVVFTLMTVALLIPGFAVALGWVFLLHPRIGLINLALMSLFDLSQAPFNIGNIVWMGVIEGLSLTPLAFIMTSVVMRSMDPALEEAAAMSSARPWQTVMRVTARVLWPAIPGSGNLCLSRLLCVLRCACDPWHDTAHLYVLDLCLFFAHPDRGPAGIWQRRCTRHAHGGVRGRAQLVLSVGATPGTRYAVITGKGYRPRIFPLGRGQGWAVAFVVAYFFISQMLPLVMLVWAAGLPYLQTPSVAVLAQLSWKNFYDIPIDLLTSSIINTVILMLVVPTITVALSVAVSWVVLRSKIRGRGVIDFFAFLPVTVPPIVFSIAALLLALFVLNRIVPIYGTI